MVGGKRPEGHALQRAGRRVRRADARKIVRGRPDPNVTAVGGLVDFGVFARDLGVDRELKRKFGGLKAHGNVVYPMGTQLRMLIDAQIVGAHRVFGIEWLAADPVFRHLAGGHVSSVDTIYDDLARFNFQTCWDLEEIVAEHGLAPLEAGQFHEVHIDIDSTVMTLFGSQEGALPGPNPRYHGRPSYHPLLARVAETDTVIAAELREGNTAFGGDDRDFVVRAIDRVRIRVGPSPLIYVRIDAAGDCTAILGSIADRGALFLVKARLSRDLVGAIASERRWRTVDRDAFGDPTRQVAEIDFQREEWLKTGRRFRVFAVRSRDRTNGKQVALWDDLDFTVQAYVTNDTARDADDLAHRYNLRAGIEPMIGELKQGFGIGKVPTHHFYGNHAAFLLKLLAFNLMQRWVRTKMPTLVRWRAPWLRAALICRAGRLVRAPGRRRVLRLAPRPLLE